jgi:hypothetical protein
VPNVAHSHLSKWDARRRELTTLVFWGLESQSATDTGGMSTVRHRLRAFSELKDHRSPLTDASGDRNRKQESTNNNPTRLTLIRRLHQRRT